MNKKTDLALEARESFPGDDVEVKGVVLKKRLDKENNILTTFVEILDEQGSQAMKKPKGLYITIESDEIEKEGSHRELMRKLMHSLKVIRPNLSKEKVLIVGLGNQHVTSDALGPKTTEQVFATRYIKEEEKLRSMDNPSWGNVSVLAPGVMGDTGMEAEDIIRGVIKITKPQVLIVIDALAARSLSRLCKTVQLTNTGISPGSGVGNHRRELSEKNLGIPVIAIGVPTVVDARTIISDHLEEVLSKQGYNEEETQRFIKEIVNDDEMEQVFVTPKNIDVSIDSISSYLSETINEMMHNFSDNCTNQTI